MLIVNRLPISVGNDDEHHEVLVEIQTKNNRNHDAPRKYTLLPIGSTVAVQ